MTERKRVADHPGGAFQEQLPFPAAGYWTSFGSLAQAAEPMTRAVACSSLEMSSLAGKRMSAYAAIPETLRRCQSPVDLVREQFMFWAVARDHYAEAAEQILGAWRGAMTLGAPGGPGESAERRDYITFPEAKADAAPEDRRSAGGSRRAA